MKDKRLAKMRRHVRDMERKLDRVQDPHVIDRLERELDELRFEAEVQEHINEYA